MSHISSHLSDVVASLNVSLACPMCGKTFVVPSAKADSAVFCSDTCESDGMEYHLFMLQSMQSEADAYYDSLREQYKHEDHTNPDWC